MENKFKVGDVVCLKSGGPAMTVTAVTDKEVSTSWFQSTSCDSQGMRFYNQIMHDVFGLSCVMPSLCLS